MTSIYFDNAATTPLHADVAQAMQPYFAGFCGNPSSIHRWGRESRQAIERARRQVSQLIGTCDRNVVFTSGGTESNHTAILGAFMAANLAPPANRFPHGLTLGRRHVVTTAIEHHAVLHTCEWLVRLGAKVTLVRPDSSGQVAVHDILSAIQSDTCLVSVMSINNETGAILPIGEITDAVKDRDPSIHVHSDMVQALGAMDCRVEELRVDSASFSAHKIHGPQGVGALYVHPEAAWQPVLLGGKQERNRRAGTENVAGVVGFGAASQRLMENGGTRRAYIQTLREQLWHGLSSIRNCRRNCPLDGAPGILNVAFSGVRTDKLLMRLDIEGIAAAAGSACTAGSLEPSHVLMAAGQSEAEALEAIRFSLSDQNTVDEVDTVIDVVSRVVAQIRETTA